MFGLPYNTVIVLVGGGLLCASAGLVGCFATLRRRALTGDALAHAALPGVCLAFLAWGERSLAVLLIGALLVGLLSVGIITVLRYGTRVREDSAIGIILSVFFGVGIVLLGLIQRLPTGGKAGLKSFIFGQIARMTAQDVYLIASVALASVVLLALLYKEFKLVVFDQSFAQVQGWPALALDLALMGLIAVTVVVALPAVGVVLVSAILIIPCVTARFWTDRLPVLLGLAALCGLLMGVAGTAISATYPVPTGPIIVLVGAGLFGLSLVLAPRRGLLGSWLAQRRFQRELSERKLLGVLFDLAEPALPQTAPLTLASIEDARVWRSGELRAMLRALEQEGLVRRAGNDACELTAAGVTRAAEVARGQRLWQLFLTEYADLASGTANLAMESVESLLPADIVTDLRAKLQAAGRMPIGGTT